MNGKPTNMNYDFEQKYLAIVELKWCLPPLYPHINNVAPLSHSRHNEPTGRYRKKNWVGSQHSTYASKYAEKFIAWNKCYASLEDGHFTTAIISNYDISTHVEYKHTRRTGINMISMKINIINDRKNNTVHAMGFHSVRRAISELYAIALFACHWLFSTITSRSCAFREDGSKGCAAHMMSVMECERRQAP